MQRFTAALFAGHGAMLVLSALTPIESTLGLLPRR
jgi:hypothetical protein